MMKTPRKQASPNIKPNQKAKAGKLGSGFTIIELIVVTVIISIIAAIAVPSIVAFIRHGQQVNRMNIARTIYLAAQSELTSMRLDRTLGEFVEDIEDLEEFRLSNYLSRSILENPDEMAFIYFLTTADTRTENQVMQLLQNAVLDRIVLDHAIVIEFNIETGVVLSVFYSDEVDVLYYDHTEIRSNITGGRPYDIGMARDRRQGYFGVSSTGSLPGSPPQVRARIFDGERRELNVGVEGRERINVLYAEFFLENYSNGLITFELVDSYTGDRVFYEEDIDLQYNLAPQPGDTLYSQPHFVAVGAPGVYNAGTDPENPRLTRFVWVIDYIERDLFDDEQPHSFENDEKRNLFENGIIHTVRAVARDEADYEIARSPMAAHTLFAREMSSSNNDIQTFEVTSARHLNNIRYAPPNSRYIQTADILMRNVEGSQTVNCITNFRPIMIEYSEDEDEPETEPFNGEFVAMRPLEDGTGLASYQFIIQNLRINTNIIDYPEDYQNVGIFAELGSNAVIRGLALFNAEITASGATNIGTLAGHLAGGSITQSWSYANVTGGNTSNSSTGGLVGYIGVGGRLDHSFNAGFFNHHSNAPEGTPSQPTGDRSGGIGFVNANQGYVGGLVGTNRGTILGSFNNARVNIRDVSYEAYLSQIPESFSMNVNPPGGIAGINFRMISNTYATNFVGLNENEEGFGIAAAAGAEAEFINNVFIGNGTGSANREQITKEELAFPSMEHGLSASDLEVDTSTIFMLSGIEYEAGPDNNRYNLHYPYPIIRNNNPFTALAHLAWGWEDILGETGQSVLVYYELYDDGSWGFAPGSQDPRELEFNTSERVVVNDGYSFELLPFSAGYTAVINETVFRIAPPVANEEWVQREISVGVLENAGWSAPQVFQVGTTDWHRFFIPNEELTAIWYTARGTASTGAPHDHRIPIRVYQGANANVGVDTPQLGSVDVEDSRFVGINPLFASELAPGGIIRSPRHIHNIGRSPAMLSWQGYTQQLNADFGIYRPEVWINPTTGRLEPNPYSNVLPENAAAVVGGVFTGSFAGTTTGTTTGIPRWISNVTITAPNSDNVGLFSINSNSGTIENVTMRNARITGQNYVGAIAGRNEGTIRRVSVQQSVDLAIPGLSAAMHPVSVNGNQHVGGVVGINTGYILDVSVVSISGRPFARGATETSLNVGGIVGSSTGGTAANPNVNRLMYLAVAPRAGATSAYLRPFSGGGTTVGAQVGTDIYYLSGGNAVRPSRTAVAPPPSIETRGTYNRLTETNNPANALTTLDLVRTFRATAPGGAFTAVWTPWSGSWSMANLTNASVTSQTNPYFPYPYPQGTVRPTETFAGVLDWPMTDTLELTLEDVFVYYEIYADGTAGVFVRRLSNPNDPNSEFIDIDLLNRYGVIVEAGYAFYLPDIRQAGSVYFVVGFYDEINSDWRNWVTFDDVNNAATGIRAHNIIHPDFPDIFPVPLSWLENNVMNRPAFTANPHMPVIVVVPEGNGGGSRISGILMFNPLFAREMYPVRVMMDGDRSVGQMNAFVSNTTNSTFLQVRDSAYIPATHFIHTPWQLQQTSRLATASTNRTEGRTFILDRDIDFESATLTEPTRLLDPGTGVVLVSRSRPVGSRIPFTATTPLNNGTTAVNPSSTTPLYPLTGNIIRGDFRGTFEGSVNTISRLDFSRTYDVAISGGAVGVTSITLMNNQDNKGVFNTIGAGGEVHDLIITNANIQNGTNNGIVASANSGTISNIAIRNSEITASGSVGGVVNENNLNSTISNVILSNTTIRATGTNGNAGGIAATNSGTIRDAFVFLHEANRRIEATGQAGGIVRNNDEGTIQNAVFVSNAESSPVITSATVGNAAGIAVSNANGEIDSVMYIARAPGSSSMIYPITGSTVGTVENSFYLSGTHSIVAMDNTVNADLANISDDYNFNTVAAQSGLPATTHELNRMTYSFVSSSATWVRDAIATDILQRNTYPYHFLTNNLGIARPTARTFPIATNQAIRLVYFEEYTVEGGGSLPRGYRTGDLGNNGLSTLNNNQDVIIVRTGYGVIVPEPYGDHTLYTVRVGTNRVVIGRDDIRPLPNSNNLYYFEIPSEIISGNDSAIRVVVNDIPLSIDEVFYRNFAGAIFIRSVSPTVFDIRTPEQMTNISRLANTTNLTFNLRRNIDFAADLGGRLQELEGAAVTETFTGTFNGNGHMISNLQINSGAENVGLFSTIGENGRVRNFTLDFGERGFISATGEEARAGAVAGTNNGEISDIVVVSASTEDEAPIQATHTSGRAGGIAGENTASGTIAGVIYLARAPIIGTDTTNIFPIVNINGGNQQYDPPYQIPSIRQAFYLSEYAVVIARDGVATEPMFDFNTAYSNPPTSNYGMSFNFDTIHLVTGALMPVTPPPPDSLWEAPATPPGINVFPYPALVGGNLPAAWPVGVDDPRALLLELELCECGEEYCEYCEHCGYCKYLENCEYCKTELCDCGYEDCEYCADDVTNKAPPECENENCEPGDCDCDPEDQDTEDTPPPDPPDDPYKPEYPFDPDEDNDENPENDDGDAGNDGDEAVPGEERY